MKKDQPDILPDSISQPLASLLVDQGSIDFDQAAFARASSFIFQYVIPSPK